MDSGQVTNTLDTPIGPVTEVPAERKKVETKPMKPKKPSAKKRNKKVAVKKPKAQKKAKKPAKKRGKPVERKAHVNGAKMLTMHARILKVLNSSKRSLTVADIAKKGGLTGGITAQYIGQLDSKARKRFEQLYLHYPTLLTLGWVKQVPGQPRRSKDGKTFTEALGPVEFEITGAGRKAFNSEEGKEVQKKIAKWDRAA